MNPGGVYCSQKLVTLRGVAKFIGEIHILLSTLIVFSCIVIFIADAFKCDQHESIVNYFDIGFFMYIAITLIISLVDIFLAYLVISGTNQLSVVRCKSWCRLMLTSLIVFITLTIIFAASMRNWLIILGLIPTLIFKPFAVWAVKSFISELQTPENIPLTIESRRSISQLLKRTTTVFLLNTSLYSTEKDTRVITKGTTQSFTS